MFTTGVSGGDGARSAVDAVVFVFSTWDAVEVSSRSAPNAASANDPLKAKPVKLRSVMTPLYGSIPEIRTILSPGRAEHCAVLATLACQIHAILVELHLILPSSRKLPLAPLARCLMMRLAPRLARAPDSYSPQFKCH